jgi:hypothetical protein
VCLRGSPRAVPQAAWRGNIEPLGLAKRGDILSSMQGLAGRPITIKSAFTRGNRPGFRTVALTMAAFPGGGRAVMFIFWSGNNPVKYTDPDGRDSVWNIDEANKTIEIIIPVKFADGTTPAEKQLFFNAARNWQGNFTDGEYGDFSVTVRVVEIYGSDFYDDAHVNTITFSPLTRDDDAKPPIIPFVSRKRDMTIYQEASGEYNKLLTHEIGHLLGLRDRYKELKDANGKRYTPPRKGWETNIMGDTYQGSVEARNFMEGLRRRVNKKVYS